MNAKEGEKRWKPTNTRRMAMLTSVSTIICKVRANASGNYIHKENI
jgi:hypothetical protein